MGFPRLALLRKRAVYLPTWPCCLLLAAATVLLAVALVRGLYSFLAVDQPRPQATVLVIEGWVPDAAVRHGADLAERDGYQWVCTAGTDLSKGSLLSDYGDFASLTAASLRALGFPEERLLVAPGGSDQRHRTFFSAAAVRRVLDERGLLDSTINVLTVGPHARRTRLVYGKAFRDTPCRIGIIALPPDDYDPAAWWQSSTGAKTVLTETIGLLHEALADGGRSSHAGDTSPARSSSPRPQPAPAR